MNQLRITKFTAQDAWELGQELHKLGLKLEKPIAFEVYAYGQILFRHSFGGLSPDKEIWIERKRKTAIHFATSTLSTEEKMAKDETTIKKKYGLPNECYVAIGGSIPLVIEDGGVIGAVTVTGLKPEEDHQIVVNAYLETLKK
jgi:uncharacterized protein (UPF0303 family)